MSKSTTPKICCVEGCNEPTFKKFARCHEHQRCEWRKHKNNDTTRARSRAENMTTEQLEARRARINRSRKKKAVEVRGVCCVEGCNEPRYSTSGYCRTHHSEYMSDLKAKRKAEKIAQGKAPRKYTPRKPVQTPEENSAIGQISNYPRLLVVDTTEQKYVEYAPVREVRARNTRSLENVGTLLSQRPNWLVVKKKV